MVPVKTLGKVDRLERSLPSCSGFTAADEIPSLLRDYAADYPDITRVFSIGKSVNGRDIWGLLLSSDPDAETKEPEARIVGGIHGNECLGVDLVLRIIEWLTGDYGENEFVSDLLDTASLVFVPLANPDGYAGQTAMRHNANRVDLNRNFGFAWVPLDDGTGEQPFSEPETRALRKLSQDMSFVLGISYHTANTYVNAPWNYSPHHPPDERLLAAIGQAYAGGSYYRPVFGWDWYPVFGDINDWSLGTRGTFDWTIEIRDDRNPEWALHRDALEAFLAYLFVGVNGLVTDKASGEPLRARISVAPDLSPVFSDRDVGDYHRILLPGTYTLTAHAPGYQSATLDDVVVPANGAVRADFELAAHDGGAPDYAFAVEEMILPKPIGQALGADAYLNRTLAWNALGPPDGTVYALSPGGVVTLDMGENGALVDRAGDDLLVVGGEDEEDFVSVRVSDDQDGPFVEVAQGGGDLYADLDGSGFPSIRYIRLVDLGQGEFNEAFPGYEVDAVVDITSADYEPASWVGDGEERCDCETVGRSGNRGIFSLLFRR